MTGPSSDDTTQGRTSVATVEIGHLLRLGLDVVLRDHADLHLLPVAPAFAGLRSAITKHSIDTVVVAEEAISDIVRLRADYPSLGITVLLNRGDSKAQEGLAAAVTATCISIDAASSEVGAAIRLAASSLRVRSGQSPSPNLSRADKARSLSPREDEVLALVLNRLTRSEIAERLTISKHTVDAHIGAIFTKLGVNSQAELRRILPSPPTDFSAR